MMTLMPQLSPLSVLYSLLLHIRYKIKLKIPCHDPKNVFVFVFIYCIFLLRACENFIAIRGSWVVCVIIDPMLFHPCVSFTYRVMTSNTKIIIINCKKRRKNNFKKFANHQVWPWIHWKSCVSTARYCEELSYAHHTIARKWFRNSFMIFL